MKLVFCGTPQFAVPSLERLAEAGFEIQLVVSQPDRQKGRGLELSIPPVKQRAQELRLPVLQPEKIKNNPEFQHQLTQLKPDAIVVVAYGRIIPPWMLSLPRLGNINVHGSLLPKYRGAAPIQWAIANGETVTGVTTMRLDEGLDTGDMLLQRELAVTREDSALSLSPKLAELGADLLVETLCGLESGTIHSIPQDDSQATRAPLLKKEDGGVDFSRTADEIFNRMRAFQPWPGATTRFRGKGLKLIASRPIEDETTAPGELRIRTDRLIVGCAGNSALQLLELQPEGKKTMSAREFINGYRPQERERLG
jgi:methionyl-tRNA formyltransferase